MAMIVCLSASASEEKHYVTFSGYGPVRIGMTIKQAEKAAGTALVMVEGYGDEGCQYATPKVGLDGVNLMLINGHIARIDFDSKKIKTLSGAGIGDSAKRILSLYGKQVVVEPHAYTSPDGFYYTIYSSNHQLGIRFETNHGVVTMFYVGRSDAVQYIEGCL